MKEENGIDGRTLSFPGKGNQEVGRIIPLNLCPSLMEKLTPDWETTPTS